MVKGGDMVRLKEGMEKRSVIVGRAGLGAPMALTLWLQEEMRACRFLQLPEQVQQAEALQ